MLVNGNQLQRLLFDGRLVPVSLRFPQEQRVEQFLEIPEALIKKKKTNEKIAKKFEIQLNPATANSRVWNIQYYKTEGRVQGKWFWVQKNEEFKLTELEFPRSNFSIPGVETLPNKKGGAVRRLGYKSKILFALSVLMMKRRYL